MNQLGGAVTPASAMKNYNGNGTNQSINTFYYITITNEYESNNQRL